MRWRTAVWVIAGAAACLGVLSAQKIWREYPAFEYNDFPVPPDFRDKSEFVFGRLMYPNSPYSSRGFGRRGFGFDWRQGGRGIFWTMDYPRSDRHLMLALRRVTRV